MKLLRIFVAMVVLGASTCPLAVVVERYTLETHELELAGETRSVDVFRPTAARWVWPSSRTVSRARVSVIVTSGARSPRQA